ncbi:MAG: glucose-6-phosphate dehydrogenase assembly protein OpcA [Solirubrobacteraceae bacterium]
MAGDLATREEPAFLDGVWREQATSPPRVESAMRDLLNRRHATGEAFVPARVLNLIAVVDKEWRGEVENRLERVGRYHPSRTIVCAVEEGRTTLDAWVALTEEDDPAPGAIAVCHEQVEVTVGPIHLAHLDSIVDPLVVTDLPTVVWAPHGHAAGVDALLALAQVVLLDSVDEPDPAAALARATQLARSAYVVDLAWLRSTPWRERVCSAFDPPPARPALREICSVTVKHHPGSGVAALLFVGWLASRLDWKPAGLVRQDGAQYGHFSAGRHDVAIHLEPHPMQVPGLHGLTIETASGVSLTLERGSGGLHAHRRTRRGQESEWTIMGASRGEAGILGEGVRQALLRDPTYRPALAAAREMAA